MAPMTFFLSLLAFFHEVGEALKDDVQHTASFTGAIM